MIPAPKPPFRLYVFHRANCHFCARALPIVDQFAAKHPEAIVVKTMRQELNGFVPKGTPTYLLVSSSGEHLAHEGLLTLSEMEHLTAQLFPDDEDEADEEDEGEEE